MGGWLCGWFACVEDWGATDEQIITAFGVWSACARIGHSGHDRVEATGTLQIQSRVDWADTSASKPTFVKTPLAIILLLSMPGWVLWSR